MAACSAAAGEGGKGTWGFVPRRPPAGGEAQKPVLSRSPARFVKIAASYPAGARHSLLPSWRMTTIAAASPSAPRTGACTTVLSASARTACSAQRMLFASGSGLLCSRG